MLSFIKAAKMLKDGADVVGYGVAAYEVTKRVVGKDRLGKIQGRVAKTARARAMKVIDPKHAQDPENMYLKTIAELNAKLECEPLADFKASKTGPSDAQVLSALLYGEQAIIKLVCDWKEANGLGRCVEIDKENIADKGSSKGGIVHQARGFVYDKRKMAEIKSLESRIANRERAAITALANDPLAAAMILDRPKVFTRLLESAASAYCFGKGDPEVQDRFVWLADPVTGERHKIFGKKSFKTERDGTTLLHKAAVMDNDFYLEALLMTEKKNEGKNRKPAATKASGKLATGSVEAFRITPVQKIVRMPDAITDAASARDGNGDTPLMLRARKLDFGMIGKILANPEFNKNFANLANDGSSLFDIIFDAKPDAKNPKHDNYKTAEARVTALLAVLSKEQKEVLLNTKNGQGQYPLTRVATSPTLALLLIKAGAREPVGLFTDLASKLKPDALLTTATDIGESVLKGAKDLAATARGHMPDAANQAMDRAVAVGGAAVDAATAAIAAHAPEMKAKFSGFLKRLGR